MDAFFVAGDSVEMGRQFAVWAHNHAFPHQVNLLFMGNSHLYEDTMQALATWAEHLSQCAAIILHNSNLQDASIGKDGTMITGWNNERGVARAIQEFIGLDFDETMWFDSGHQPLPTGWRVIHDPTSFGLTILIRDAEIAKAWIPPKCACDDDECACIYDTSSPPASHRYFENFHEVTMPELDSQIWQWKVLPTSADVAAGIRHASSDIHFSNIVKNPHHLPAFVISSPAHLDKRTQTRYLLQSAGFSDVQFVPFVAANDLNMSDMLAQGQVSAGSMKAIINTPWVGSSKLLKVLSLMKNHLQGVKMGLQANHRIFGVFEDDLMLAASPHDVVQRIGAAIAELPSTADILYLEYCYELCSKHQYEPGHEYIVRAVKPQCAGAILFTQKGAKKVLTMMKNMFLALDNMYAELISHGFLEAYLITPPVLLQDGFWSNTKEGDRALPKLTHRPFSIICRDQELSDLDLTVLQLVQSSVKSPVTKKAISSDTFEKREWRSAYQHMSLQLSYYALLHQNQTEKATKELLGQIHWKMHGFPVILEISNKSLCWPDFECEIDVVLSDESDNMLASHTVRISPRMLLHSNHQWN